MAPVERFQRGACSASDRSRLSFYPLLFLLLSLSPHPSPYKVNSRSPGGSSQIISGPGHRLFCGGRESRLTLTLTSKEGLSKLRVWLVALVRSESLESASLVLISPPQTFSCRFLPPTVTVTRAAQRRPRPVECAIHWRHLGVCAAGKHKVTDTEKILKHITSSAPISPDISRLLD